MQLSNTVLTRVKISSTILERSNITSFDASTISLVSEKKIEALYNRVYILNGQLWDKTYKSCRVIKTRLFDGTETRIIIK